MKALSVGSRLRSAMPFASRVVSSRPTSVSSISLSGIEFAPGSVGLFLQQLAAILTTTRQRGAFDDGLICR